MPKATWNGTVIAESDDTIIVDNNHYFPRDAVKDEYLRPSDKHTTCFWKGKASYFTLEVNGERNEDAAWYYPDPKSKAANIKDYVAFWHRVQVEA